MLEIPLFPLGTVLYPTGLLALKIFEQRYLDMTKECIRDNSVFGVCLIRNGAEVAMPATPFSTGCTARIADWDMPHLGLFTLACTGESVFQVLDYWSEKNGLLRARVEARAPELQTDVPQEYSALVELLSRLIEKVGAERFPTPIALHDANWVAYRLAEVLPLDLEIKQAILQARDPAERLGSLHEFLQTRQVVL
jgi:Lon protease-like protein